jgi:hypothetical protein
MTADEFYNEFKDALKYLGVTWGDKHLVEVSTDGKEFTLKCAGRKISFGMEELE